MLRGRQNGTPEHQQASNKLSCCQTDSITPPTCFVVVKVDFKIVYKPPTSFVDEKTNPYRSPTSFLVTK